MNKFQQLGFDSLSQERMIGAMAMHTPTEIKLANVDDSQAAAQHSSKPASHGKPTANAQSGIPLPEDRARQFATAVQKQVNGALLKCEERFPGTGHHSVLYVVVEDNAAEYQRQVGSLHKQFFGPEQQDPLAPVRLEVVDRCTDEAVQRLVQDGLLRLSSRTSRTLWPAQSGELVAAPLSSSELQKAMGFRQHAAHKLKVAKVLSEAGLREEARPSLFEAMLALACMLAVQQRLPEPENVYESLLPPFSIWWGQDLAMLRKFAADPEDCATQVLEKLSKMI